MELEFASKRVEVNRGIVVFDTSSIVERKPWWLPQLLIQWFPQYNPRRYTITSVILSIIGGEKEKDEG